MTYLVTAGGRSEQTLGTGFLDLLWQARVSPRPRCWRRRLLRRRACLRRQSVRRTAARQARVADPPTPSAALFENPAGLTAFDTFTHGGGLGIGYGRGKIEASTPAGFSDTTTMKGP